MILLKFVLIAGLVSAAVLAYRSPLNGRGKAIRRLMGLAILLGAVASVLWPEMLTAIAQRLGVGRGADLLLYALAVAFLLSSLGLYRRIHDLEDRIATLARDAAMRSARIPAPSAVSQSARESSESVSH